MMPPRSRIEAKDHAFREKATRNRLSVLLTCPYNEAIIDETRIESALRAAFGVPDLEVKYVRFEIDETI